MTNNKPQPSEKDTSWPPIRQRGKYWLVDCGYALSDKRRRKTFSTKAEALTYAVDCRRELKEKKALDRHEQKNRAVRLVNLTDTQRAEILEAYRLLSSTRGLVEAVQFFLKHNAPRSGAMTVTELRDAWIVSKRASGRREKYLRNCATFTKGFIADYGERPAHSITRADVQAFMDARGYGGATRNTYRRALLGLFNYGKKVGCLETNPANVIEVASEDLGEIKFYDAKQAAALLKTALKVAPEMVPYLAIGLFAGLRPERELGELTWENINLERKNIYVPAIRAKKRRSRFVDIQPNLAKWLELTQNRTGKIFYSRRKLRLVCEKSGVAWIQDGMRHSFGSHHLAAFDDRALTERQMGLLDDNSVLFDHYAATVDRTEGKAYFKIKPPSAPSALVVEGKG
jgi:integrase